MEKIDELLVSMLKSFAKKINDAESVFIREELDSILTIKEVHIINAIHILKKENNNTLSKIANYMNITPATISTSISSLIKKGYVDKDSDFIDKRIFKITLTQSGERINGQYEKASTYLKEKMIHNLSDKEKILLLSVFSKM